MNKTGPRVIVLLMVIPLLLIFTTSTVVDVTEILVDVPVSSIEILGDEVLDIAIDQKNEIGEYDNSYKIETVVKPEDATHKTVTFSVEEVEGKKKAEVIISSDGVVRPLSEGTVKIVATAGARSDEIKITYTSDSVYSVQSDGLSTIQLDEGEEKDIKDFVSVYPQDVTYESEVEFSKPLKASYNSASGMIKGRSSGEFEMTFKVSGIKIDPQSGTVTDTEHELKLPIAVKSATKGTTQKISFAGKETLTCATMDDYSVEFSYNESFGNRFKEEAITYTGDTEAVAGIECIVNDDGTVGLSFSLSEKAEAGKEYEIAIKLGDEEITTITVKKALFLSDIKVVGKKSYYMVGQSNIKLDISYEGEAGKNYSVEYYSKNSDVVTISKAGLAKTITEGTAEIYVKIFDKGDNEVTDITVEPFVINVVDAYISLNYKEKGLGLKQELVLAGNDIVGEDTTQAYYQFGINGKLSSDKTNREIDCSDEKLIWSSSDTSIAEVSNGKVTVKGTGKATIVVESSYNERLELKDPIKAEFTVVCRKDAVFVDTYEKLMYATKNCKESVLQDNIMLAPKIAEKGFTDYENYLKNVCTGTMMTTADYSYYKDNGHSDAAQIRYCVNFTASVYGNGYSINGEYITRSKAYTGYSVFNGPLDLVRLNYENNSSQNASVKAQDNIVFVVQNDNVVIENVELKGCSDASLKDENSSSINLGNLDYCGTVLEIIGDNCTVSYSHINNGRTVVRIYGSATEYDADKLDGNPDNYRITAALNNCILENAREFILKIGSNQAKKSATASGFAATATDEDYAQAAPFLTDSNNNNYSVGANYTDDEYFYNHYVMTDVTLQDVSFLSAGLFSIGFESKFAGVCLHGFDYNDNWKFSQRGWKNIAGTSYPAVLRIKGDVRFYDWKAIDTINSSTLIEGDESTIGKVIKLDIGEMIKNYVNGDKTNNGNMVVTYQGTQYVNGAVAFYGGGKNYSYIDYSEASDVFKTRGYGSYTVGMNQFNSQQVIYCAGKEPFKFALYDKEHGITVEEQLAAKRDSTAYYWVKTKTK